MHTRVGFWIGLALTLVASAAVAAAAGDEFKLTPPDGWAESTPNANGVLAVWAQPDSAGFRQNINIVSEPYRGSLASYVEQNVSALQSHGSAITMGPQADVATCDDHPARFISWKATIGGHPLIFEQTISVWFGRGYVVTYTREQGEPALDDARAALATLCVRQGV